MKLTSIIIPTYNALAHLKRTIDSIRLHTDAGETPYEIIVVDSGSADGTCEWCLGERIHLLSLPRNSGFPAACNAGLRYAEGDSLLLMNNDVTVSYNWLSGLLEVLDGIAGAGIVGPVTNGAFGRQQYDFSPVSLTEFHRFAEETRRRTELTPEPVLQLASFCMLFKREVYERVGSLDERFSQGHYEDDDYCLRARMHGYGLFICRNVVVHYQESAGFERADPCELQRIMERNKQLFVEKWQIDPAIFTT